MALLELVFLHISVAVPMVRLTSHTKGATVTQKPFYVVVCHVVCICTHVWWRRRRAHTMQRQAFIDFDADAVHWEVAPTNAALYDKQSFEFALVPCPKMAEVTVDPVTFKDHFDQVKLNPTRLHRTYSMPRSWPSTSGTISVCILGQRCLPYKVHLSRRMSRMAADTTHISRVGFEPSHMWLLPTSNLAGRIVATFFDA